MNNDRLLKDIKMLLFALVLLLAFSNDYIHLFAVIMAIIGVL